MQEKTFDKKLTVSMLCSNGYRKYVHGNSYKELVDGLLIFKDSAFIIWFVKNYKDRIDEDDIKKLSDFILSNGNYYQIYDFSIAVNGQSRLPEFVDAIIKSENGWHIRTFASYYKDKRCGWYLLVC